MAEPRRTFAPVVLLGLAASALTAVASAKPWVGSRTPGASASLGTGLDRGTTSPVAAAVSLVLLAAWGVLLVTRGVVRRVFAVVATLAAAGVVVAVVVGHQDLPGQARDGLDVALGRQPGFTGWFWVAGVAALLAVVAGVLAVRLVPHWPQMGTRYDAPAAPSRRPAGEAGAEPESERDLWDALDEGRDPTER